jgi:hypothetical protein
MIRDWAAAAEQPTLLIIDTWARARPRQTTNQNQYSTDYNELAELQKLAHALRIAIVVVHHERKMDADDPFDTVSGTLGMTELGSVADGSPAQRRNFAGLTADVTGNFTRLCRRAVWRAIALPHALELRTFDTLEARHSSGRPCRPVEDTVEGAKVGIAFAPQDAQRRRDGSPTRRQDDAGEQHQNVRPGRTREQIGKFHEPRQETFWQRR